MNEPLGPVWASLLLFLGAPFMVVGLMRWINRTTWPTFRAGGSGLDVFDHGHWTHLDWGEIHGLRPDSPSYYDTARPLSTWWTGADGWLVETATREYRLVRHYRQAPRLVRAISRVLAAREERQFPLATAHVPEGAISLTRLSGDPAVERGVSVIREETDDA